MSAHRRDDFCSRRRSGRPTPPEWNGLRVLESRLRIDLHCHTTASDGALTPAALCGRAIERGVGLLAITDHDTFDGYRAAADWLRGQPAALTLLPAVEYSSLWQGVNIHVVGLGIDIDSAPSQAAAAFLQSARTERAVVIGERLEKLGFHGAWAGARELAGESQIGRPHFARFLVQQGHVASADEAFDRYLGAGKPGDVKLMWPLLAQVIEWVVAAGGVAVLAHPLKYKMTGAKLRRLVTAFRDAGGGALEVVSSSQSADGTAQLARLCTEFGLEASLGSDFHAPLFYAPDLGGCAPLPAGCRPVWQRWLGAVAAERETSLGRG